MRNKGFTKKANRWLSFLLAFMMIVSVMPVGGLIASGVEPTEKAAVPTASPTAGIPFDSSVNVTLASTTPGAKIYYTTDGSEPTTASMEYKAPFEVAEATLVKAIATSDNTIESDVATFLYPKNDYGKDKELIYDFRSVHPYLSGKSSNNNLEFKVENVLDYSFTGIEADLAANKKLNWYPDGYESYPVTGSAPWCYSAYKSPLFIVNSCVNGMLIKGAGSWGSVKIYVPDDTTYNMSILSRNTTLQDKINVYLAPITDPDVEMGNNRLDPKYRIGENIVTKDGDPVKTLGTKALTKGEYLLTYEAIASSQFQWLANFKLEYPADWKDRVKAPAISCDPVGDFTEKATVTITSTTADARIYYTTDGQVPTTSSNNYTASFDVTDTTTVRAIAIKDGMLDSAITTKVLVKKNTDVEKQFDFINMASAPNGYQIGGNQKVAMEPTGMRISLSEDWDTTQGSFTCKDWEEAGGHPSAANYVMIPVNKYINMKDSPYFHINVNKQDGSSDRAAWSFTFFFEYKKQDGSTSIGYWLLKQLPFEGNQWSDAEQYFNKSYDVKNTVISKWLEDDGALAPDGSVKIIGILIKIRGHENDAFTFSKLAFGPEELEGNQETFVATPIINPTSGTITKSQEINFTTSTEDASIHYTTDGSTPTEQSQVYSAPFTIDKDCTVKAIGVKSGLITSAVASATYKVSTVEPPMEYTVDFTACSKAGHSSDIKHATIEECGWAFNQNLSSNSDRIDSMEVNETGVLVNGKGVASDANLMDASFDFYVPVTGYYNFYPVGATNGRPAWTRVIVDGHHLSGNYGGGEWNAGKVYLSKGTHNVTYEITTGISVNMAAIKLVEQIINPGELLIKAAAAKPINSGVTEKIALYATSVDGGGSVPSASVDIRAVSQNTDIAIVEVVPSANGTDSELAITGVTGGQTTIDLELYMCNRKVSEYQVPVTIKTAIFDSVKLDVESKMLGLRTKDAKVTISALDPEGTRVSLNGATIVYSSDNTNILTISDDGTMNPIRVGNAKIKVDVTINGVTKSATIDMSVKDKKTSSTIYTPDMIAAARENVKKYSWAKSATDSFIKKAESYVGKEEQIWSLIPTQELPRSITVGWRLDPEAYTCRYCGCDLRAEYGLYSWIVDPLKDPWKIKCPNCRRKFPSNDFGKYYETGLDENGFWSYEKAKENGKEYLKNVLYPEMDEKLGVTDWGVDDGWGYLTGKTWTNGSRSGPEAHSYIAYYHHWGIWHNPNGLVQSVLSNSASAYLYTGDIRFGRTAAIIADRVADIYPTMYTAPYNPAFFPVYTKGKAVDLCWECAGSKNFVRSYDMVFDVMDDPQVISFLSKKAAQYNMANPKTSAELIRENCENGILREVLKSVKEGNISGNFGMHQSSAIDAAVALDSMPETKEMIDWAFQTGTEVSNGPAAGGNIVKRMIDHVSRDGLGNESSPGYNVGWVGNIMIFADVLANYPGYEDVDLYKNPKYIKMLKAGFPMVLSRTYTPDIADSGATASTFIQVTLYNTISAYVHTRDPEFAQFAYFLNGNSTAGLHSRIYDKNPESIQKDIEDVIRTYGEWDGFDKSTQMAGYGFTALKGGSYYPSAVTTNIKNTQRNFWMYYGIGCGHGAFHGHGDALNIGLDAYGLNMAPDNGYPEACDGGDKYVNQVLSTIVHNTVQVDAKRQTGMATNGKPMHYDGDGRVKIMDVDAPQANASTSIFRRTLVMVDASDEVSYGIDFFHVKGGSEHVYSFHSLSDKIHETENLALTKQVNDQGEYVGTYAGPSIAYGAGGYNSGYSWIKNIRRDENVGNNSFAVDFKVMDQFRNILPYPQDLHLRMTMLGGTQLTDVTLGTVIPPQRDDNPKSLEYVLARRKGSNLDSMFTTVFEPYKDNRYIASQEIVPVKLADGGEVTDGANIVRAVKVTLTNGRVDYVVYATSNEIEYRIDDTFNFKGFVGVYTLNNGDPVYSYLNDGTKMGDTEATAAYTGKVTEFTKELSTKNTMTVKFDTEVDVERLANTFIYVENDGSENAAYPIYSAKENTDGTVTLDMGDITAIRSSRTVVGMNATSFNYNISEGQNFRIPLATETDAAPIFTPIEKQRGEIGSELKIRVEAMSPVGRELTYSANKLPYGANFDPKTHTITWIPAQGQIGENHMAIDVTDGSFTVTQDIVVSVYGDSSNGGGVIVTPPDDDDDITDQPDEPKPEKDEKSFALKKDAEVKAETKLGSVVFPEGSFDSTGNGKLSIEKNGDKLDVNVTVGGKDITPSEPVKVSVNYKPNETMKDQNCIIVKDSDGNIIPSGKFENGTLAFYTEDLGSFTVEYNPKSFNDLNNHTWANDAVTRLAARGIINGTSATTYNPATNITRADFTTLVIRTFGFESDGKASFDDVDTNAYYANAVGIAKELGIVGGVDDKNFAPTAQISREDMMVIVSRAIEKAGLKLSDKASDNFADMDVVSGYAKEAVEILTASGIIAGSNGKVNPKGKTTRAEVAVILDRLVFINR